MINKILKPLGLQLIKIKHQVNPFPDFEAEFVEILEKCKPYTMTSEERLYAVYQSVSYIINNEIEGDIVECGVWRGGSTMCGLYKLVSTGNAHRSIYLYDTYEGMAEPGKKDTGIFGESALDEFNRTKKGSIGSDWCLADITDVTNNVKQTGYPLERILFVKGKVEDTIPQTIPDKIAILRLDTDWYESTYHELVHLYPRLVKGGVLIIDDYGHWKGAREAVDNYFKENNIQMLLNRIDYTGRIGVKM